MCPAFAAVISDYVAHGLGTELPPGPEGFKQFVSVYRSAFPDTHLTIEDQIAEGDKVVVRWTVHATHTGGLMGIPATGKQVVVAEVTINLIPPPCHSRTEAHSSGRRWPTAGAAVVQQDFTPRLCTLSALLTRPEINRLYNPCDTLVLQLLYLLLSL